ncbi:MAG: hypothetical protein EOO53_01990 [Gammaproteobacteria bacterium]|nr:MAG: hypothetical protein EOO53_01990 [Gammaproteobacteria bacterium]
MKIIPLAHQAIRKLALIGLLFSPFFFTQSHAVELVGKPVARQSAAAVSSVPPQAIDAPNAPEALVPPDAPEPPEALEGESAQDSLQHAVDELRENFGDHDEASFGHMLSDPDVFLPVVIVAILFGGPTLLVILLAILHYRSKSRRRQNINMNIDKLLAAGRDIPIELLLGEEPRIVKSTTNAGGVVYSHSDESMRKGVRNIGLGTGWLVFLTIMFGIKIGAFGFIFIGLGISQVVIWKLSDSRAQSHPDPFTVDVNKVQD